MFALNFVFTPLRFALICLLLGGAVAQAQPGGGRRAARQGQAGARLGQLENAKIAFLTGRLLLTQDQAQRFWPVYNEFTAKRRDLNRGSRQLRQADPATLTDQQARDNLNQAFARRQQELNLDKDYAERFQKVISVQQVGQLFQAERDFTKEVIRRVAGRRTAD